jgi:hypothetical protein
MTDAITGIEDLIQAGFENLFSGSEEWGTRFVWLNHQQT